MTTTSTRTTRQRWNSAWRNLQPLGVFTRVNYMSCCRTCAVSEFYADEGCGEAQPMAWTYGGQGNYLRFSRDEGEPSRDSVYIYHSHGGAQAIIASLEREGFTVVWDGDVNKAVLCKFR